MASAIDDIQPPLKNLGIDLTEKGDYVGILSSQRGRQWTKNVGPAVGDHYATTLMPTVLEFPESSVRTLLDSLMPERETLRNNAKALKRLRDEASPEGSTEGDKRRSKAPDIPKNNGTPKHSGSSGAPSRGHGRPRR